MALVVEDGTGLVNADSYISVADADTYFTKFGTPVDWENRTTEEKECLLREATQFLDITFNFRGNKADREQALEWPRWGAFDNSHLLIDEDVVPQIVKDATAEVALRSVQDELIPDRGDRGSVVREFKKIGQLEKEIEYSSSGVILDEKVYPKIKRILRQVTIPGTKLIRG